MYQKLKLKPSSQPSTTKPKPPSPKQIKPELSSIKSLTQRDNNSQFDDLEIEQVNLEELDMHDFYKTNDIQNQFSLSTQGETYVFEMLRDLLSKVAQTSFENAMLRKVPLYSEQRTFEMFSISIDTVFLGFEDIKKDFTGAGLEEDIEPGFKMIDPWIRNKVVIDTRPTIPSISENNNEQSRQLNSQSHISSNVGLIRNPKQTNVMQEKIKKELIPAPIDLNEPLDISQNEEDMRDEKEKQLKDKQDLIQAEYKRRQREQKEEQMKYEMVNKDKKSKQFTYDFDGQLIPVNSVKSHKLPPATYNINSNFAEDPNKIVQPKAKRTAGLPAAQQNQVVAKKKTPEEEKDFVKFMTNAPPVLDTLLLQTGVSIKFDGKLREGPRPQTVELATLSTAHSTLRMPRKDYFDIVKSGNLNRNQTSTVNLDQKLTQDKTREFDGYGTQQSVFNLERLRRMQQQQLSVTNAEGGIKINSTKIFENLTHTIPEDEEIQLEKPKPSQLPPKKQLPKKSPVDEFNLAIGKNQNWGKEVYATGTQYNKDGLHHPRERDLAPSIGSLQKKPRDRVILSKLPQEDLQSSGIQNSSQIVPIVDNIVRSLTSQGAQRKKIK